MGKATRSLSGASQKKYFRDLLSAEEGVSPEARKHILAATEREIAHVRVRLPIPERHKGNGAAGPEATDGVGALETLPDGSAGDEGQARGPCAIRPGAACEEHAAGGETEQPSEPQPAFDPFAFSVVVVRTKEGRDGLLSRLARIEGAEDLLRLARAQHIAVPAGLEDAAAIRAAILEGTEARIANRRAAAS